MFIDQKMICIDFYNHLAFFLLGQASFLQLCCQLYFGLIFEFSFPEGFLQFDIDDFEDAADFTDFMLAFDLELTADTSLKTEDLSSS